MPNTTPRGLPYPLGSERPDGPTAFQNLANAINGLVDRVFTDNLDKASPFLVPGALVRRAADSRFNVPVDPSAEENAASAGYVNRLGHRSTRVVSGSQLGGVEGLTDVDQFKQTFTIIGNRWVELVFSGQLTSEQAGAVVGVRLLITGQGYTDVTTGVAIANAGYRVTASLPYGLGPGTYEARIQLAKYSGTPGKAYVTADAAHLSVRDLGPR